MRKKTKKRNPRRKSMPKIFWSIAPTLYLYCWGVMMLWVQRCIYKVHLGPCMGLAAQLALVADIGLTILACTAVWMDRVWGDRI